MQMPGRFFNRKGSLPNRLEKRVVESLLRSGKYHESDVSELLHVKWRMNELFREDGIYDSWLKFNRDYELDPNKNSEQKSLEAVFVFAQLLYLFSNQGTLYKWSQFNLHDKLLQENLQEALMKR